ncbi:recombinase family protein [Sinomonas soli]
MPTKPRHSPPRAIGYVRVSTEEQVVSGLGLDAQRREIQAKADAAGWRLEFIEDAGLSGKSMARPGIQDALQRLNARKADILVVAKLDRLSRSLADGAAVMQQAMRRGWSLVSCDAGDIDMSTPTGEALAGSMLVFSQLERRLIGQRTAAALAVKRANGVRLGRPQALSDDVVRRVLEQREAGLSMAAIAAGLEADSVPTAREGSHWHASTVRAVLLSQRAAELRGGTR